MNECLFSKIDCILLFDLPAIYFSPAIHLAASVA